MNILVTHHYLQLRLKIPSVSEAGHNGEKPCKDMKTGKTQAMELPPEFRAIHVNNCFVFHWKCTEREAAIFLADKKEKLDKASDRLSKDKAKIMFLFRNKSI